MSARLIGSRGSDLALWQSRTVLAALNAAAPPLTWHSDITVITTRGDVDQSPYLAGSVEKGFFTRELEVALLERRIDLVVHSLKDLPTAEPGGLVNRTILPRASAADWLLIRREFHEPREDGLLPLKAGARVGASQPATRRPAGTLCAAREVRAAARQCADARAASRRRAERRRHRARGRRTQAPAARPHALCADRSRRPSGGCRRRGRARWPRNAGRATPPSRRRSPRLRTRPAWTPRAGSANSCASSRADVPPHSAATSSAIAPISASPRSAAGPRTVSNLPPASSEESHRESFIRAAVADCKPVELSETAARALGELFARAEALIPAGVSSPVRAFRKVGGTPVYFREAQRRARRSTRMATATSICAWPGVR